MNTSDTAHQKHGDKHSGHSAKAEPKKWHAGESSQLKDGGRLVVDAGETSVGIFRVEGKLYAYVNACKHMGGPVCQGKMLPRVVDVLKDDLTMTGQKWDESDPQISCPWHGFEYSIKTGEHSRIKSIALDKVPVEETDGVIYVTV